MSSDTDPLRINIPSYLSEHTFRTYEPHIARGVSAFPQETQFTTVDFKDPSGRPLSGNTFAARFRDSITSLKRFKWETALVDVNKLWSISGQFAIAYASDGTVWFRNKGKKGRPTHLIQEAREKAQSLVLPVNEWSSWTPNEIEAVCLLIHTGKLSGPIILAGVVSPEDSTPYEQSLNVVFTYDPVNNKTIIT
jgi:hypothetical protein